MSSKWPLRGEQNRRRQLAESCDLFENLAAPYNEKNDVNPYVGIMFEVSAHSKLAIESFAMDIRLNSTDDLSVEVYTRSGPLDSGIGNEADWDLLAATKFIPFPDEETALIPASDFKPVVLSPNENRCFYITMKGPFIDFNVYALDKTGELEISNNDLDIMVGLGLTEYRFPQAADTTLDPKFAGSIFYRRILDCNTPARKATKIEYRLLVTEIVTTDLLDLVAKQVDEAMNAVLNANPTLQEYVSKYNLEKSQVVQATPVPYAGQCPTEWALCPPSYISAYANVEYNAPDLDGGLVQYEFFRSSAYVLHQVEAVAPSKGDYRNIGYQSVSATFQIFLSGTPLNVQMDEIQLEYFSDVTRDFLIDFLESGNTGTVLAMQVDGQKLGGPTNDGNKSGSITLSGIIFGGQVPSLTNADFQKAIETAFRENDKEYLELLKISGLRPGEINENGGLTYFQSLSGVGGSVDGVDQPTDFDPSAQNSNMGFIWTIIGGVLGGLVFLVVLFYAFRWIRKKQHYRREVANYREQMREERRQRRAQEKGETNDPPSRTSSTVSSTSAPVAETPSRNQDDGKPWWGFLLRTNKGGAPDAQSSHKENASGLPGGPSDRNNEGQGQRNYLPERLLSKKVPTNTAPEPIERQREYDRTSNHALGNRQYADIERQNMGTDKIRSAHQPNARAPAGRVNSSENVRRSEPPPRSYSSTSLPNMPPPGISNGRSSTRVNTRQAEGNLRRSTSFTNERDPRYTKYNNKQVHQEIRRTEGPRSSPIQNRAHPARTLRNPTTSSPSATNSERSHQTQNRHPVAK